MARDCQATKASRRELRNAHLSALGTWGSLAAASLVCAFALYQSRLNGQPDFFIYRFGAELGLRGESPYDTAKVRAAAAKQFPDPGAGPDSFVNNCGYFLPPMAVLVYAPFALLPWTAAKIAWAIVSGFAAFGVTRLPERFRGTPSNALQQSPFLGIVPFVLVVNFLALAIVQVGQTTLLVVGCVAIGQWCFEKGRPTLGVLLWSVAFIKPHVALPLVPLAWYLGGWKRAAALLALVGIANVLAAAVIGGSPLFLREYFDFLATEHKTIAFNLAERNPEITSWNRLLYVATGFLIEQTAAIALAGYLIWYGLLIGRCNVRPSSAWAAAATAAGAALCPQVLGYETLVLTLAVPWALELFEAGRRRQALLAAVLLAAQWIPYDMAESVGVSFHRPLAVALLALLVLVGPIRVRA